MSFPLGPRTVAALIDAISDGYSHSDMTTLFIRVGADRWDNRSKGVNKAQRAQTALQALRRQSSADAERIVMDIVAEVLKHGDAGSPWARPAIWWPPLVEALLDDGFEWDSSSQRLLPSVEGISSSEERGLLEQQLVELEWDVPAAHYRQAVRALAGGEWESANAQVRSFLEALIPAAAAAILKKAPRADPLAALQDLRSADALFEGEFDFARGLWKLASPRGSHAGLSDRDEARFRMLTATAYARLLLSRLPA